MGWLILLAVIALCYLRSHHRETPPVPTHVVPYDAYWYNLARDCVRMLDYLQQNADLYYFRPGDRQYISQLLDRFYGNQRTQSPSR